MELITFLWPLVISHIFWSFLCYSDFFFPVSFFQWQVSEIASGILRKITPALISEKAQPPYHFAKFLCMPSDRQHLPMLSYQPGGAPRAQFSLLRRPLQFFSTHKGSHDGLERESASNSPMWWLSERSVLIIFTFWDRLLLSTQQPQTNLQQPPLKTHSHDMQSALVTPVILKNKLLIS